MRKLCGWTLSKPVSGGWRIVSYAFVYRSKGAAEQAIRTMRHQRRIPADWRVSFDWSE